MRRRSTLRVVPLVLGSFLMTGCIEELAELFTIVLFSESDDPEVRETGEALAELREEREARDSIDRFIESGDQRHIDDALALRPDDTEIHGYAVAAAIASGDASAIESAKQALALAEAKRLAALTEPGDPPISAAMLERNVLGEILVAQTRMLGGSLTVDWDPPPPDASADERQLYADYCATRAKIQNQYADDLTYIPLPPCP